MVHERYASQSRMFTKCCILYLKIRFGYPLVGTMCIKSKAIGEGNFGGDFQNTIGDQLLVDGGSPVVWVWALINMDECIVAIEKCLPDDDLKRYVFN